MALQLKPEVYRNYIKRHIHFFFTLEYPWKPLMGSLTTFLHLFKQLSTSTNTIKTVGMSSHHYCPWSRRVLCPRDEPALVRNVHISPTAKAKRPCEDAGWSWGECVIIYSCYMFCTNMFCKATFPGRTITPKKKNIKKPDFSLQMHTGTKSLFL